ncbi:MAG: T9SS type A sorting domain-containing protein [Nonlabens sp.]
MKRNLLSAIFALCTLSLFAQGNLGIVGPAANGWPDNGNPTPDIMLTNNGDGTHSISALTLTTGAAKFRTDMDWANPNYGGDTFPSGMITGNDIPVTAGIYDIVVDLNTSTYTFTDVATFTDIEITGSGLSGGGTLQFATTDGVNYSLDVTQLQAGTIEFREVGTNTTYGAASFPTGTATQGGMGIPSQAGFYKVAFNLNTGDYSFTIPSVGLVGPGANGWPDANNITDIAMNTANGDTYTLNNQQLTSDMIKFRQDQDWSVNWGGDAFPSGTLAPNGADNIMATAGTYDIVFSRSNLTYAFNTTASVRDDAFAGFRIFPNPSSTHWVFENPAMEIDAIAVYDTMGKQILDIKVSALQGTIDTSVFAPGMYVAQVGLANGSTTSVKIIKQ